MSHAPSISNSSRVVVVGAGAVGCFYGGMLARQGVDVTLIARPQHVEAITAHGLYMNCQTFQEHVPIRATTELSAAAQADLVLLCVKSPDTEATAEALRPVVPAHTVVLSLQNGVDNAPTLQRLLPNPVFPAVVYVATAMDGPGQLKHNGRGELVIGEMSTPGALTAPEGRGPHAQVLLKAVAALFASAGVPCDISDQVKDALWFKYLINCVVNAVSAIGQIEYGRMVQVPEVRTLLGQLTTEFLAVAAAEGVHFDRADVDEKFEGLYRSMAGQRSSTAQDIARGKRTEIDHLNGLLTRLGAQHGIPTPTHQALYALIKLLEYRQHITT
jgi:2-dehydropantoate 2-reductase